MLELCPALVLISTVSSLQQPPDVSAHCRVCCAHCLGRAPCPAWLWSPCAALAGTWSSPALDPRSDRCLNSAQLPVLLLLPSRCYNPLVSELAETCASGCANPFSAVSLLCPSLPSSSVPVNSNTRSSPAMSPRCSCDPAWLGGTCLGVPRCWVTLPCLPTSCLFPAGLCRKELGVLCCPLVLIKPGGVWDFGLSPGNRSVDVVWLNTELPKPV